MYNNKFDSVNTQGDGYNKTHLPDEVSSSTFCSKSLREELCKMSQGPGIAAGICNSSTPASIGGNC